MKAAHYSKLGAFTTSLTFLLGFGDVPISVLTGFLVPTMLNVLIFVWVYEGFGGAITFGSG
jgi:hypothetical protein